MGGQSYRCPDCSKWFLSMYVLGQHMKAAHPTAPLVLNKRDFPHGRLPANSTYVGRGTFTGNPHRVGVDGSRDEVIDRYISEREGDEEFLKEVRIKLRGRHLVCHCAPLRCHADWLLCIANETPQT